MDSAYSRWQDLQDEVSYQIVKDNITIQYKAFRGHNHFATIIVWSHKVNKSCIVVFVDNVKTTRLCGSLDEAKKYVQY